MKLDIAPSNEGTLFKLGRRKNWPVLRQIIKPLVELEVTDVFCQAFVDEARKQFNSSRDQLSSDACIFMTALSAAKADDEAYNIVQLHLAVRLNPDEPESGSTDALLMHAGVLAIPRQRWLFLSAGRIWPGKIQTMTHPMRWRPMNVDTSMMNTIPRGSFFELKLWPCSRCMDTTLAHSPLHLF